MYQVSSMFHVNIFELLFLLRAPLSHSKVQNRKRTSPEIERNTLLECGVMKRGTKKKNTSARAISSQFYYSQKTDKPKKLQYIYVHGERLHSVKERLDLCLCVGNVNWVKIFICYLVGSIIILLFQSSGRSLNLKSTYNTMPILIPYLSYQFFV